MEDGLIQRLVEFVEKAAPVMWEAAYRQVYVNILQNTIYGLFFLVGAIVCYMFGRYWKNREAKSSWDEENYTLYMLIFLTVGLIALFLSFLFFVPAIGGLINPDYYAIKNLINLFPMGGG